MRNDNFEEFWAYFSEAFQILKVPKETARSVFEVNFAGLRKLGKGDKPYLGPTITYVDPAAPNAEQYYAFLEGYVYIFPNDDTRLVGKSNQSKKAISFSREGIRVMTTNNGFLTIEDLDYHKKSLTVEQYEVTDELMKAIEFNNIDYVHDYIAQAHILPDAKASVDKTGHVHTEVAGVIYPDEEATVDPEAFYPTAKGVIATSLANAKGKAI